jgi:hypothetical protein
MPGYAPCSNIVKRGRDPDTGWKSDDMLKASILGREDMPDVFQRISRLPVPGCGLFGLSGPD